MWDHASSVRLKNALAYYGKKSFTAAGRKFNEMNAESDWFWFLWNEAWMRNCKFFSTFVEFWQIFWGGGTLDATTFSLITLSITVENATLRIKSSASGVFTLGVNMLSLAHAENHDSLFLWWVWLCWMSFYWVVVILSVVMLGFIMLSVVMLSIVMLSAVMLSVMVPQWAE